jgi:hypothetical protein
MGTVGVLFSLLCAGATVTTCAWILISPNQSSSDVSGFGADGRVLLLYPLVLVGLVAAALSTDGGQRRTQLGFGSFAVALLAVLILKIAR